MSSLACLFINTAFLWAFEARKNNVSFSMIRSMPYRCVSYFALINDKSCN